MQITCACIWAKRAILVAHNEEKGPPLWRPQNAHAPPNYIYYTAVQAYIYVRILEIKQLFTLYRQREKALYITYNNE